MDKQANDTPVGQMIFHSFKLCGALLVSTLLAACGPSEVTFHTADDYPERLSDWGIVSLEGERLRVSDQTLVYELNTALFSDYALKLRTLYLPEGTHADFDATDTFNLPVGSIISKTFIYPKTQTGALLTSSCLLYTSPSPRDRSLSRMPSSA